MPFLHSSLLQNYKAFLAKLSPKARLEEASWRYRQRRRSKLLTRLRRNAIRTQIDPFRAFRRLKMIVSQWGRQKHKALSLKHVFRRAPISQVTPNGEMQALFGSEGFIRVSSATVRFLEV